MSSAKRIRITATPMYPGSFYSEEGSSVVVDDFSAQGVLAAIEDDGKFFAIEVTKRYQKRWDDGEGGEMWTDEGELESYRIYIGEALTAADVAALPGDNRILLDNMRFNSWNVVVKTRRGNFQPVEFEDIIVNEV